ncbi:MAG: threonine aldolase family protein [Firmicutes bacterium]|nr:threonine aldolase family protein [Bacillota bacterium]
MNRFIDLISDTITLPSQEMLQTVLTAQLGDAGRMADDGRGEDMTTRRLEDLAAEMTGKEAALFFPTGTIANTAGILSQAKPASRILTEERQHIMVVEKLCYMEDGFRMKPAIYQLTEEGGFDIPAIEALLKEGDIRLALVENTHNFSGGKCISVEQMKAFYDICHKYHVPVHMDGARLFNAAEGLSCTPADICRYTDSTMFCISKGLGAPMGSLLCSTRAVIDEARRLRSLLGGTLRQSGVAAACGIYALQHNVKRLKEDRQNAQLMYSMLGGKLRCLEMTAYPQSDILIFDFSKSGLDQEEFDARCKEKGLRGYHVSPVEYRFVFHLGITEEDTILAAQRMLQLDEELFQRMRA